MVLRLSLLLLFYSPTAWGFVLLSGKNESHLDVSEDRPSIKFQLSLEAPEIVVSTSLASAEQAELSSQDYWYFLVRLAMKTWNDVADAYVKLEVEFSSEARLDPLDQSFSIVVDETNYTTAAFAAPQLDGEFISDCDIAVSTRATSAGYLAYTLVHELGHCLGLGHNHADFSSIMGYARNDYSLKLGLDDEAGLVYLYPKANVGRAKELAACGVVSGARPTPAHLGLLGFLAPALLVILLRRRPRQAAN